MVPKSDLGRWPSRGERWLVVLFFAGWALFGLVVEKRGAFMHRRMGDVGCYFRAGYAVRRGGDHLYDYVCDNGWHYNYPPLFGVLMAPLADPPARDVSLAGTGALGLLGTPGGAGPLLAASALAANPTPLEPDVPPTVPYVPYAVSVALFYALSLLCLALAVHGLAAALERSSRWPVVRDGPAGTRRWWGLRIWPVLICLPPIGHTLVRGQANLLLLALVCGLAAEVIRGRRFRAGLYLAGAVCLKIFPAYLLLVPLWRRDGRCLAGCAAGLFVGLALVPTLCFGPARAVKRYEELAQVLVGPALRVGGDQTRAKELIEVTATDSQSFLAAMHNTLHLNRARRPPEASPTVRYAHLALVGLFTLLTLAAARRRPDSGPGVTLFVGALTLVMVLASPVCHTHYFTLALPLVMGLLAWEWERRGSTEVGWGLVVLFALQVAGNVLPLLPAFEVLKDVGLAMYTALALWLAACVALWRRPRPTSGEGAQPPVPLAA
jgi:alpha-1,2-mannosyltransferase